jgi:hypothetical protein
MDIKGVLSFESVPEGTCMKWIWDIEPRGFYKLMGPLVRRMGEREERTIWMGLKHLLEARERPSQQRPNSAAADGRVTERKERQGGGEARTTI